jgi:hypothetical protein
MFVLAQIERGNHQLSEIEHGKMLLPVNCKMLYLATATTVVECNFARPHQAQLLNMTIVSSIPRKNLGDMSRCYFYINIEPLISPNVVQNPSQFLLPSVLVRVRLIVVQIEMLLNITL